MGINFAALESGNAQEVPSSTTPNDTVLNLDKGAVLNLTKSEPGLVHVRVGAGWDVSSAGPDFDLDISAYTLGSNGKLASGSDIVYFNNKTIPGITLNGDNRTGEGEGDDETIDVDLNAVSSSCTAIVFAVNIYEALTRQQTFGMVNNSYIRLINNDNSNEICRYMLKDDYSTSTGVIFAKLKKENNEWKFEAVGEGKIVKDLSDIAALFM